MVQRLGIGSDAGKKKKSVTFGQMKAGTKLVKAGKEN
jgi:hypothetical protein